MWFGLITYPRCLRSRNYKDFYERIFMDFYGFKLSDWLIKSFQPIRVLQTSKEKFSMEIFFIGRAQGLVCKRPLTTTQTTL